MGTLTKQRARPYGSHPTRTPRVRRPTAVASHREGALPTELAQLVTEHGEEVSDRAVSGWEGGKFAPDRRFVRALEDVLGAQGVLLQALGLGAEEGRTDRFAALEARVAEIERHLGIAQPADVTQLRPLPAHERPGLAAAASGDQSKRGKGPSKGRTARRLPPPVVDDDLS